MPPLRDLSHRCRLLLRSARFITLATVTGDGRPWASTVNYVPMFDAPLRLVWYSMREAVHSRNIEARFTVTGSIFRADLGDASPIGLDGLQLEGQGRAVPHGEVPRFHDHYYQHNFPDPHVRQQWMLPVDEFRAEGPRRFYELTVEKWWLLDIARWLEDKHDQRVSLPAPSALLATLAEA